MKIIIVGCGRLGRYLAVEFLQRGEQIAVVDTDSAALRRLPDKFPGQAVLGTGIDEDVLKRAGIEGAGAVMAVTRSDNINIMVSMIAREVYRIPNVIARIYDPTKEAIYNKLGVQGVCPTALAASRFLDLLAGP